MKLRIVHTFGRNAGAVIEVAKDVVRFGRAGDNDVCFDAEYDREASAHHAEARFESGAWVLVDLKSRNGLYAGGERVERRALHDGDEVTFGAKGPRVRVEIPSTPGRDAVAAPRVSGTALMSPLPGAFSQEPPPAPVGAPAPMPVVHVERHPAAPRAPFGDASVPVPREAFGYPPAPGAAPFGYPPAPAAPAAFAPPSPGGRGAPAPIEAPRRPAKTAPDADPEPPRGAPYGGMPVGRIPAAVQAPPAGARVGQRTMAVMISDAVAAVTGRSKPMKTAEINAMVDERVGAATAGHRRAAFGLGLLLLVALAAFGGLVVWGRQSSDEIATLREQLAKLPPEDPRRKDIENKLGTLHPPSANFGRSLYDKSKKGIFMLATGGEGFCTAFAVRPNILATNAHCVIAAQQHRGSVVALENEGHGQVSYAVTDMKAHPQYRDKDEQTLTPDVGIVTISGRSAVVLDLATAAELQQVGAGDEIYLIGFPGRLMDASNPAATFLGAHIGRVTNASGRPGTFAEMWLIQHDAQTTHGTSGSPVFNGKGHVVAINAGGYLEGDDETISGKKTEVVKDSPYKFGMRVDLLAAILK